MKKIIYVDPTTVELRVCISEGRCWWCGKSGWKRLAQHTSMAHGIFANDIREMAIMLKRAPTCSQQESQILSQRRLRLMKEGKVKIPDWRLGVLVKHEYSEAGLKSLRDKMPIMRNSLTPEVKERATQRAIEKTSKPHPCLVCGKIITRAKPLLCSPTCRLIAKQKNAMDAAITRKRLANENPEYKLRMSQVEQHLKYKKPHKCSRCGNILPKSRPKYSTPQCRQKSRE